MANVKHRGIAFEHGDGALIVPVLPVGALQTLTGHLDAIEERAGQTSGKELIARIAEHYVPVAHAALKLNYPDITRAEVLSFLTLENFVAVYYAAINGSGDGPKTKGVGEHMPVGNSGQTSTGPESTGV